MADTSTGSVLAAQKRAFYEKMEQRLSGQTEERSQFLTANKHAEVCDALCGWEDKDAQQRKACHKEFGQVYAWAMKYQLVTAGNECVLILRSDDAAPLDQSKTVSHQGWAFDHLHKIHIEGGHCKAKTFAARVEAAHGKSIPRWVPELYVQCCPTCTHRKPRKPSSAGHKPILTKGLGSRGQVDLIDFQSCPDGQFKFLLNYQDHGIKLCDNRALIQAQHRHRLCPAGHLYGNRCASHPADGQWARVLRHCSHQQEQADQAF